MNLEEGISRTAVFVAMIWAFVIASITIPPIFGAGLHETEILFILLWLIARIFIVFGVCTLTARTLQWVIKGFIEQHSSQT